MAEENNEVESGIVLLAKMPGRTSFASLSAVKKALGTRKVGHTGTLDSFADGLLVVLTGRLTRLVPHITAFDKKYLALIEFGEETDTLDPTGTPVKTGGRIPSREEVESVLLEFIGEIEQTPPIFSAVHIGGRRASDLARSGKTAEIPSRRVRIFSLSLVDFRENLALISVHCSKGTYIRSLARDVALRLGTLAHLRALRRTSVGPFALEEAAGFSSLKEFSIDSILGNGDTPVDDFERERSEIKSGVKKMTRELSERCGMVPVTLSPYFEGAFSNGRPLNRAFFTSSCGKKVGGKAELSVFRPGGAFAGVVLKDRRRLSYGFVIPENRDFSVYSWKDIVDGKFSEEFRERGTALTIGSFDGPHLGHDALFSDALSRRASGLVPGAVTFTRSMRAIHQRDYSGDVASLPQRLDAFRSAGFAFAIVIDFSEEFARIEGTDFLGILCGSCGMRHLSEGRDFRCGFGGAADIPAIAAFSFDSGGAFSLATIDSVLLGGERVSSSRIRRCVQDGDFGPVSEMLGRPFALDCSGYEWRGDGDSLSTDSPWRLRNQVLPPDGKYRVIAVVEEGRVIRKKSGEAQSSVDVRAYRSDCTLEGGHLRLSLSGTLIGGFVRALQFGCPDENIF